MSQHVGVSNSWKNVIGQWVGVGGVWKRVTQQWVGVNGVWKLSWSAVFAPAVSVIDDPTEPLVPNARIGFYADGSIKLKNFNGIISTLTWFEGTDGSPFDIYLSGTGDTPTGATINEWLNLGSTREWALTAGAVPKIFSGTYQIRSAGGGDALASGTFYLEASQEPDG
jgi:hypothetical protein